MRNFVNLVGFVFICAACLACKSSVEQSKLDTRLCLAAFNGDLKKIKALLPKGADPNTSHCGEFSKTGYPTPLFFALLGFDKSVEDLIAGNEMYDTTKNDVQRLTILALLAAGANPNTRSTTNAQETPLMYAEFLRSTTLVRALTEAGADPTLKDTQGRTSKDYGSLTGEPLKMMASGHVVVRFVVALAQKDAVEKEIVEEVVPKN